jgi:hypothetical protein
MPTIFTANDIVYIFNRSGFANNDDAIVALKTLKAVNDAFSQSGIPGDQIVANIENSMQLVFLQTQLQALSAQQADTNATFAGSIERTRSQLQDILKSIRQ